MAFEESSFQAAVEHHRAGRLQEAVDLYQQVLASNPSHVEALYLLGVIAHQAGYHEQAVELNRRAILASPNDVRCYNVAGLSLMELGRDTEAESCLKSALAIEESPECLNNLGLLLKKLGRLDEAIGAFQRAISASPHYANAHYNLGSTFRQQERTTEAIAAFELALQSNAEHSGALAGLGQMLRGAEAVPFLERASALLPEDAGLRCDLGDALQTAGDLQRARDEYRKSVECDSSYARAWYAMGCAEESAREFAAAVGCYRKALECSPGWVQAQHNLAQSQFRLGQVEEAFALFSRTAETDGTGLAQSAAAVIAPGVPSLDHQAVLDVRRVFASRLPDAQAKAPAPQGAQIRVGYVSAYFQGHNWMKPVWGLINRHDRERFELHLFSDAPASRVTNGYRPHPNDHIHDISNLSNEAAADLVEQSGIDILVDLNGYSVTQRLGLFALRPGRVQVAWFNMYATSGMSCYDYLVGDAVVVRPQEEEFYSEAIHRVPGSYLTFEVAYAVPDVAPPPCLVNKFITFGSLAPQYKITPEVIETWREILSRVPNSRLLIKNTVLGSAANREFVRTFLPEQVQLEGPADHYAFLETYDRIDIALDTFPYNGGTTTTEAIWQGVPVIAFNGDRWVARTSATILEAGGLGDFVGKSVREYVESAVRLGNASDTPQRLAELRGGMRGKLLESPVCDTAGFARHMEEFYNRIRR
jgi:protein O-GlcNAc transferase